MDRQTKFLNTFYLALVLLVGLALFVERFALAAFIALVVIVIQLSEIATYLQHLLRAQNSRGDDTERRHW